MHELMKKMTSGQNKNDPDKQSNGPLSNSKDEAVSNICEFTGTDDKICSFLANKTAIVLMEISRSDRGREIEHIRERLLEAPFPDNVFVSVVVFHRESNLRTVGEMTASLLRNQHPGMNCQIYYAQ
jgi:hypothetical protein